MTTAQSMTGSETSMAAHPPRVDDGGLGPGSEG